MKRIPLSHFKSLGRGETFVVGPIDKEIMGKEAAINKLEIMTFEQARLMKELEAELELFHRESKEEEQVGIFDIKEERVEIKSNEA